MARIRTSSVLYESLSASFYIFCFAGLIFQETIISVNYFQFKVVTNIKLIQPEEVKLEKYLNWCFEINELFNRTKFETIHHGRKFKNFSMRQLFEIAYTPYDILEHAHNGKRMHKLGPKQALMFILTPSSICYQIQVNHAGHVVTLSQKYTKLVRYTSVSLSSAIPDIDANRFNHYALIKEDKILFYLTLTSYDYYIHKLKYPYVDNCFHYPDSNYLDNWDAINYCYNKLTGSLLEIFNVYASDSRYLDSKIGMKNVSIENYCRAAFSRPDCERNTTYTRSKLTEVSVANSRLIIAAKQPSQDPSFVIYSKVKIDPIDYFTFILGTVGTWFGISILNFNPVPHLFEIKKKLTPINAINAINECKCENEIIKLKLWTRRTNVILIEIQDCLKQVVNNRFNHRERK